MVVGEFADAVDLLVLGGGPGGYAAAIRAAQLGREVTLVERARPGRPRRRLPAGRLHPQQGADRAGRRGAAHARPARRRARAPTASAVSLERFQAWRGELCARPRARRRPAARRPATCASCTARRASTAPTASRCARPRTACVFFEFEHAIVATGSRPVALPGPALRRRARAGLDRRAGADRGPRQRRRRRRRLHRPRAGHGAGQARRARDRGRGARPRPADRRRSRSPRPSLRAPARARRRPAAGARPRSASRTARSWSPGPTARSASRPSASIVAVGRVPNTDELGLAEAGVARRAPTA